MVDEVDLPRVSAPARRALVAAGYVRLDQLAGVDERELQKLHGMGPKALRILREALEERGLSFRT
ncbi:DNA-binding protein [Actinomadura sp. 9N407]|uniref:DNA-binding protein n=1 Tax=Actinomadura sp. 9N407 TaxID=3375154 RepID=UPI00379F0165